MPDLTAGLRVKTALAIGAGHMARKGGGRIEVLPKGGNGDPVPPSADPPTPAPGRPCGIS